MTRNSIRNRGVALMMAVVLLFSAVGAGAASKSDTITFKEAAAIAQKEVEGTVTMVELDHKGRTLIYEVEVLDSANREHDIDIDAATGEVLTHTKDRNTKSASYGKRIRGASVTAETAIATAQKEAKSADLASYELDVENGKVYWEVKLYEGRTEYEVVINASTGKVLYVDVDYDD